MLKAIEIQNFKAFGERTRIEFAPITLIFGENSAGKTSILHSLNLLKQTRESPDRDALLLPRVEGGTVDLGSFQEMIFDHDLARSIVFRCELDPTSDVSTRHFWHRKLRMPLVPSVGVETAFARPTEKDEIKQQYLSLHIGNSQEPTARFEPVPLTERHRRQMRSMLYLDRERRVFLNDASRVAECTSVTTSLNEWEPRFINFKSNSAQIVAMLQARRNRLVHDREGARFDDVDQKESHAHERVSAIQKGIQFYKSDFGIEEFMARMRQAELQSVLDLEGFVPVATVGRRSLALPEESVLERDMPGAIDWFAFTLPVAPMLIASFRALDIALRRLFPMGPFRRPPERWYVFTGTSPHDVGYRGDLLPDLLFRRPDLVGRTNEWLNRLGIGYRLVVRSVGTRSHDLFEVRLKDVRRGKAVDVALSDVGFGISQLLPIIVQSLSGERRIISVEQPEVHVHPRLQADLADLLAETIREPQSHQFIIETHSEHLILRLQKLVREKRLQPSDVSVIYVERGPVGSRAKRLHLNDQGEFIDEWPGGFFPERLRELM